MSMTDKVRKMCDHYDRGLITYEEFWEFMADVMDEEHKAIKDK